MRSSLPVTEIDSAVVRSLREALTQERLEQVIQSYVERAAAEADQVGAQRAAFVADIERIDRELAKLGDAVAGGAAVETLLGAIKAREAERRGLQAKLQSLDRLAKASTFNRETFAEGVREILKNWDTTVKAAPAEARRALRDVGVGRSS